MKGPFFVKSEGQFVLTEQCRECAFCSNEDETCILSECFINFGVDHEEEETER